MFVRSDDPGKMRVTEPVASSDNDERNAAFASLLLEPGWPASKDDGGIISRIEVPVHYPIKRLLAVHAPPLTSSSP
ncbi:hypothetical protein [Jiangella muralis]|uniref:hypothetical protein n=1 Tax=Jiangella muralis TaxID=702383 RepID=UPI0012FA9013|nr:hypothetical protein [Jiangella muralis]